MKFLKNAFLILIFSGTAQEAKPDNFIFKRIFFGGISGLTSVVGYVGKYANKRVFSEHSNKKKVEQLCKLERLCIDNNDYYSWKEKIIRKKYKSNDLRLFDEDPRLWQTMHIVRGISRSGY